MPKYGGQDMPGGKTRAQWDRSRTMTGGLQMKYFVLNPAKDDAYGEASRKAMLAYSAAIMQENPELATGLFDWVRKIRDALATLQEQKDE